MQVLFTVPCAVVCEVAAEEGGGHGLTLGVLNIAVVLPQVKKGILSRSIKTDLACLNTSPRCHAFLTAAALLCQLSFSW
jgi:hypothetical protein